MDRLPLFTLSLPDFIRLLRLAAETDRKWPHLQQTKWILDRARLSDAGAAIHLRPTSG